jgi:anthranilate phosphoribosyltransferase
MLGPMVNPSFPANQMTGVYSLETARLYNYIYQRSNKKYTIVYSLDGYDEVSLTSDFKLISNHEELLLSPESIGLNQLNPVEILGGESIADSAGIFLNILEGNGSEAMNSVVITNAGIALRCIYPEKSIEHCIEIARESLMSLKALKSFKRLIEL